MIAVKVLASLLIVNRSTTWSFSVCGVRKESM